MYNKINYLFAAVSLAAFINAATTASCENEPFVEIKKTGEEWTFSKDDKAFFSLGVCSVGNLYGNPYVAKVLKKEYKKKDDFFKDVERAIRDLNFNTLGAWTAGEVKEIAKNKKGMYYVEFVSLLGNRDSANMELVWNKNWRNAAEKKIRDITQKHKENPYLIGYMPDNEIPILKFKTGTVKEYVDFVVSTFKKYDPNHLVFSERMGTGRQETFLKEEDLRRFTERFVYFKKYDCIAVNMYFIGEAKGYAGWQLKLLNDLHNITQRPILISEAGIGAYDSGIEPSKYWAPSYVATQKERGATYKNALSQLQKVGYVVGLHWFQMYNGHTENGKKYARNCGIIDDNNRPYADLTDIMSAVNRDYTTY